MNDYYKTDALDNFKKGLISKVSTLPELDMKMIGTVAVIAIGAFLGLFLLMNGGK